MWLSPRKTCVLLVKEMSSILITSSFIKDTTQGKNVGRKPFSHFAPLWLNLLREVGLRPMILIFLQLDVTIS